MHVLIIEMKTGYSIESISDEMPMSSLEYSNITLASKFTKKSEFKYVFNHY